jgi:hypothetical protein
MVSLYYRQNKSGIGSPYIRGLTSNANHGSLKWIGRDGKQDISGSGNWPVNEWIRLKCYATTNSNETGLYISNYIGGTIGDKIWSFGPQIETGSKFSPLVRQTRSTTDAWKDRSGNGNHGDFAGGVDTGVSHRRKGHVIEPKSNAYLDFDGSDDYVTIPDSTDWSFGTGNFAIDWWMKLDTISQTSYAGYIATFVDHWTNGNWIIMNSTHGDNVRLYLKDGEGDEGGLSAFPRLGDTNWHHLCLTRVGNTGYLYIDTVQEATGDLTNKGLVSDDSNPLTIGRGGGVYSNIKVGSVRIYKGSSLSVAQIKANFKAQRGRYGV